MRSYGNIYSLHNCAAIICCGLRVYVLTCWRCLHWFKNTLDFSCYLSSVNWKLTSTFYHCCYNHICLFVRIQVSWSSYFILLNRQLEHFSKLCSWHLYSIHFSLKWSHVSALHWVADIPQMSFHGWPRNTVLRFQIFIGLFHQNPDPTYGHQLPIFIRLITMFHR